MIINWLDLIYKRTSTRNFLTNCENESLDVKILEFIKGLKPLFGSKFIFSILQNKSSEQKIGTYGIIKNPSFFLVGKAKKGEYQPADFGYLCEKALLFGESLGLGSCWLGGTFKRDTIANSVDLKIDEEIPAIIAFGIPSKKTHFKDRASRFISASSKRKSPLKLFRESDGQPLFFDETSPLTQLLESILVAPSASNKQPWRIIYENGNFNFFIHRNKKYGKMLKLGNIADLQMVDIGIAISHLELATTTIGYKFKWKTKKIETTFTHNWEYVITLAIDSI